MRRALWIAASVVVLSSCQSAPKAVEIAAPTKPRTVREAFPREKPAQSEELFELLDSVLKSKGENVRLRAYDVSCLVDVANGARKCSLRAGPDAKARKYELSASKSERLSSLLFDLPVRQGDSGVATPFIECQQMSSGQTSSYFYSCSVATELDYPGP